MATSLRILSKARCRQLGRPTLRSWQSGFLSTARWNSSSTMDKQEDSSSVGISSPIDSKLLHRYLRIEHFTELELDGIFDRIRRNKSAPCITTLPSLEEDLMNNGKLSAAEEATTEDDEESEETITQEQLKTFIEERIQEMEFENALESEHDKEQTEAKRADFANDEASRILQSLGSTTKVITKEDFRNKILEKASSADYGRTLPITVSMLLVGSSVGIITPVMPFVVENLGLSPGQYGMVVSAFALAKMVGNVPSAILVERHGRKPYLVYSLLLLASGVGGVGFATNFEQLFLCRLFTGLGVAALSTAATMSISDISNPRNRAQTMAPMMSAFAAGTALGPAIGGLLADKVGVNRTFELVGVFYLGLTAINTALLSETKSAPIVFPWQKKDALQQESPKSIGEAAGDALSQWGKLMANPRVRNVVIMNGFYWVALAGSQMTLLPLMLTASDGLNMTATGVGQVYMGMSLVQVLGNPVFARSIDRIGKAPAILAGCTLISSSMVALPMATDVSHLAPVLGLWATGSSILSTAPVAYISDTTDEQQRAQAIALLRTSGDVGFLFGASAAGALADWTGNLDVAMECSAGVLMTATAWFGFRKYLSNQVKGKQ